MKRTEEVLLLHLEVLLLHLEGLLLHLRVTLDEYSLKYKLPFLVGNHSGGTELSQTCVSYYPAPIHVIACTLVCCYNERNAALMHLILMLFKNSVLMQFANVTTTQNRFSACSLKRRRDEFVVNHTNHEDQIGRLGSNDARPQSRFLLCLKYDLKDEEIRLR
jgi:hypothetical protein